MSRGPEDPEGRLLSFRPSASSPESFKSLGVSQRALQLGIPPALLSGHWCSPCGGIWFGTPLEAECPRCGNRQG